MVTDSRLCLTWGKSRFHLTMNLHVFAVDAANQTRGTAKSRAWY